MLLLLEQILPHFGAALLKRYPDLFPVLNVLLVTPVLLLVFLWATTKQVTIGLANGMIPLSRKKHVL